jgi:hypothetical protein
MNLEAWLKEDHPLGDQLKVMEGICDALNDAHSKGVLHRALEPFNIEVEGDGACDLRGAIHADAATATAASRYRAPEVLEGASYSPQADIYAVGVVFYEMLSGKSPGPGERPAALGDLRPDISRDLTDAVMGCLEKGPDWRPKDLSYLLQVVRTLRASGAKGGGRSAARTADSAPRAAARSTSSPSTPARRTPASSMGRKSQSSGSNVPLIAAALVLLVGAGVGGWLWLQGSKAAPKMAAQTASTPPPPAATPTPEATPSVTTGPTPAPGKATPTPAASATPTPVTTQAPATPPPATPPPVAVAVATPVALREPTPAPVVEATPTPPPVATAATDEPAILTAISPLMLRRGQTTILDIRGTNLKAEMQLRLSKAKGGTPAIGYSIARQRLFNPTLLQVLVKLEENADTGSFVASVVDSHGVTTNGIPITIAK